MLTVGDIFKIARNQLNDLDASGYRYSDADLVLWLKEAMTAMYSLRPDVFLGQYATLFPLPDYQTTDPLTLPAHVQPVLADWLVYRAEMSDDENVEVARAQAAATFFAGRLV